MAHQRTGPRAGAGSAAGLWADHINPPEPVTPPAPPPDPVPDIDRPPPISDPPAPGQTRPMQDPPATPVPPAPATRRGRTLH
ncbi:hypothetical protein [Aquabacterium sp. J223]|uniref:hypothetical protein n=1 Tax=Aquabacterium sp. J223 TaxID=2898431 RepID=UPI0021AD615A|nr:hypothetical protein [Aquabacterium sp. J223]UUX96288.1 hypothetical protein LRS07_02870 [Aquabacterium sp. J223]